MLLGATAEMAIDPSREEFLMKVASEFSKSKSDFVEVKNNSAYFPLDKSRMLNEELDRHNYEQINLRNYSHDISKRLKVWRGFNSLSIDTMAVHFESLFNEYSDLPEDIRESLLKSILDFEKIKSLPAGWQYLLPNIYFENLELDGSQYANIAKDFSFNMGIVYKVASVIREDSEEVKEAFISSLSMPTEYRSELGYILGYRWNIDEKVNNIDGFGLATLLFLPVDVLLRMNRTTYDALNLSEKLNDVELWNGVSLESKIAIVSLVLKFEDSPDSLLTDSHGHLLAGAPRNYFDVLKERVNRENSFFKTIESGFFKDIMLRTSFDVLRVRNFSPSCVALVLSGIYAVATLVLIFLNRS